jgi:hypothetical protein
VAASDDFTEWSSIGPSHFASICQSGVLLAPTVRRNVGMNSAARCAVPGGFFMTSDLMAKRTVLVTVAAAVFLCDLHTAKCEGQLAGPPWPQRSGRPFISGCRRLGPPVTVALNRISVAQRDALLGRPYVRTGYR